MLKFIVTCTDVCANVMFFYCVHIVMTVFVCLFKNTKRECIYNKRTKNTNGYRFVSSLKHYYMSQKVWQTTWSNVYDDIGSGETRYAYLNNWQLNKTRRRPFCGLWLALQRSGVRTPPEVGRMTRQLPYRQPALNGVLTDLICRLIFCIYLPILPMQIATTIFLSDNWSMVFYWSNRAFI